MFKQISFLAVILTLSGCGMHEKDRALLAHTREVGMQAGTQSQQALEEAREARRLAGRAAREASIASQNATLAAAAATEAAEKADRIFMADRNAK